MATTLDPTTSEGDGKALLDANSIGLRGVENFAFTVPATQTVTGAPIYGYSTPVKFHGIDVRRAIPAAKIAAVKAVLVPDATTYAICYGSNGPGTSFVDGRGFRIQFKTPKTEAQVNTFLAAVETAVTT